MADAVIQVYDANNADEVRDGVALPGVLSSPVRLDIVQFVHDNLAKNHRQPYAISKGSGHQTSAESWGTGRAVARIPRVGGGGTHRSGQGAFGNMCRDGRMFAPTKIWRRWHRHVNLKQKRSALCSSLAATAVPSLVMARGHRIDTIPEVPLVLDNLEKTERTKDLIDILKRFGAYVDVERVIDSKALRAGRGKLRNRRHTMRRGPLIIYEEQNAPITKAFRNIPGVDLMNVHRMNILTLSPGGTLGRFVIWSSQAFRALDGVFENEKAGFKVPRPLINNSDISAIIASDAIQSVLKPIKEVKGHEKKRNPLKNNATLSKLDPARAKRRLALKAAKK